MQLKVYLVVDRLDLLKLHRQVQLHIDKMVVKHA